MCVPAAFLTINPPLAKQVLGTSLADPGLGHPTLTHRQRKKSYGTATNFTHSSRRDRYCNRDRGGDHTIECPFHARERRRHYDFACFDRLGRVSVQDSTWNSGRRKRIIPRVPSTQTTRPRSEERRVGKECRSRWSP